MVLKKCSACFTRRYFSYKECACEISCTDFGTIRGCCFRKRSGRIIFCTGRPPPNQQTFVPRVYKFLSSHCGSDKSPDPIGPTWNGLILVDNHILNTWFTARRSHGQPIFIVLVPAKRCDSTIQKQAEIVGNIVWFVCLFVVCWWTCNQPKAGSRQVIIHSLETFFLSWVSKTQPNHWTKRMANNPISHLGPKNLSRTGGPEHYLVYGRPNQIPNLVGKTDHNVGGLACILGLTNPHN